MIKPLIIEPLEFEKSVVIQPKSPIVEYAPERVAPVVVAPVVVEPVIDVKPAQPQFELKVDMDFSNMRFPSISEKPEEP